MDLLWWKKNCVENFKSYIEARNSTQLSNENVIMHVGMLFYGLPAFDFFNLAHLAIALNSPSSKFAFVEGLLWH